MKRARVRLWVAASLALAVGAGAVAAASGAQAATGCKVTYSISSQWQGGFGASVTIDNLGDAVSSWRLGWTFGAGQTVAQLWNGTVSQSGSQVTVTNASYNGSVPSGGSVNFGFNGNSPSSNPIPTDFTFNGVSCNGPAPKKKRKKK